MPINNDFTGTDYFDANFREDLGDHETIQLEREGKVREFDVQFVPAFPLSDPVTTTTFNTIQVPCTFNGTGNRRCGFCADCKESYR